MAHSMEIGGAERSLLGLLENIDTKEYQIDLFLLRHTGEFMNSIPKKINLLPKNKYYASLGVPIKNVIKSGNLGIAFGRIYGKVAAKWTIKKLNIVGDNNIQNEYSHKYTVKHLPIISEEEYDLAISFMSPHYFVSEKVKAKKYIAWIHTDYLTFQVDRESELRMWNVYDYIASISDKVTESFLRTFPELRNKIILIPNIIPQKLMERDSIVFDAEEEMPNDGSVKLLSIGRFTPPKNFDNIPDILKRINDLGINVKWYLIGYGPDEELVRKKIKDSKMEKKVILLGKKVNPYPYIRACDIYVQPSRYEGKCVSVIEAQILHKPVVITNYATSGSQLQDGIDGVIVPIENEECAKGIVKLINNENLRQKLIDNTKKQDYVGADSVDIIYGLVEG